MEKIYESIHDFSRRRIISERQLRQLAASGKVPGIKTDRGFKINVRMFLEKLEELSKNSQSVDE